MFQRALAQIPVSQVLVGDASYKFGRCAAMVEGVDTGLVKDLFAPDWSKVAVGRRVDAILTKLVRQSNVAIGRTIPGEQVVRVNGLSTQVETDAWVHFASLLGMLVTSMSGFVDVSVDSSCHVLLHRPMLGSVLFN